MVVKSGWQANLEALDQDKQGLVMGGTLSRRFSNLPLWLSHPGTSERFTAYYCRLHSSFRMCLPLTVGYHHGFTNQHSFLRFVLA